MLAAAIRTRLLPSLSNTDFRFSRSVLKPPAGLVLSGSFGRRLGGWFARIRYLALGLENRRQLGGSSDDLLRAAKAVAAELYLVHLEAALWVGSELISLERAVGVDFEDWYSEDLLPEARKRRPIKLLKSLERRALSKGAFATCTSRAMAEALALEYRCEAPVVIYNAFPWSDRETIDGLIKDRNNPQLRSLHWYSQTLGRGRGLEDLIAALPLLESDLEIHLRGKPTPDFRELLAKVPATWRNRVFVHDLVSNDELLSRVAEHDIGFAGEQKYCRSRDLTVTNKILHYLLAGLAVVASDTSGQREVADQAKGAVLIYRAGEPGDLASQLNELLSAPNALEKAKEAALAAARRTFCWEQQAPKLLGDVEAAMAKG